MQIPLSEETLGDHLQRRGLVEPDEELRVEPAGDGNINWVRRVRLLRRGVSWVVKQARPALERFPQYQAPTERIVFEARYYEVVSPQDADRCCPEILDFDADARVLVLEDLGAAERLDHALARGAEVSRVASTLAAFLGRVHRASRDDPALASRFQNDAMRRLHGDHIFHLPLRANDFPLPAEVAERAAKLQGDAAFVASADAAYARYREPRGALVHGDVQAGNVLLAERGPVLLDAEIAHVGDPAFDVGSLVAHLLLPGVAAGEPARASAAVENLWRVYVDAHGATGCPRFAGVARYAGLEMLRRSIGAARVAAVDEASAALAVIDAAERILRRPPERPALLI